ISPVHRQRCVDRQDKREILLFEEHLQKEFVQARVDVPVNKTQIIAVRVMAVVSKLDADAAFLAPSLALKFAGKNLATDDIKLIQLGHKAAVDEVINALRSTRACRWVGVHCSANL